MMVDLSYEKIIGILAKGTQNQRSFIQDIEESDNDARDVLQAIETDSEESGIEYDLLGWLNGGAIRFAFLTEEIQDEYYCIHCENGYGVVFE